MVNSNMRLLAVIVFLYTLLPVYAENFYTGDKLIFTTPENIRKVITKHRLREVSFTGKGDTASKTAFLVKQFFLEEVGFVCAPDLYLYKSFNFDFSL